LNVPRTAGVGALIGLAAVAALVVAWLPPIPQDPGYHRMADGRTLLGVPNALNVLSNLAFVAVGALGLWGVGRSDPAGAAPFVEARERWAYAVFFASLGLTGLGSAYYHWAPDNARLVWDRLPLAATLMGLFAATIAERFSVGAGVLLLPFLTALGLASVFQWYAGEVHGHGDLRLYGVVQFYPMLAIPLLLLLGASRYTGGGWLAGALGLYAAAKLFEALDAAIFRLGHVVSGHTLKHLAAALAGLAIWRMLYTRHPVRGVLK
jgi:hypothetical protein